MSIWIVIPARYASTRLPGKPLCDIHGKPLVQWVYERAQECGAARVIVATDDVRIQSVAAGFGAEVCLTAETHVSGTTRIYEVITRYAAPPETLVVNWQGDEPLMSPVLVKQVAALLADTPQAVVATLCVPFETAADVGSPHQVKVVCDSRGFALYFSRAPIPYWRDEFAVSPTSFNLQQHWRHVGLYAYRAGYLAKYVALPPSPLEVAESLEQLRVLESGEKIIVGRAAVRIEAGVDTPEDLARVRARLAGLG